MSLPHYGLTFIHAVICVYTYALSYHTLVGMVQACPRLASHVSIVTSMYELIDLHTPTMVIERACARPQPSAHVWYAPTLYVCHMYVCSLLYPSVLVSFPSMFYPICLFISCMNNAFALISQCLSHDRINRWIDNRHRLDYMNYHGLNYHYWTLILLWYDIETDCDSDRLLDWILLLCSNCDMNTID